MGTVMTGNVRLIMVSPYLASSYKALMLELLDNRDPFGELQFYSIEYAIELITQGKMQLWFMYEEGERPFMFMLTEVEQCQRICLVRVCLIAGSGLRRVLPLLDDFEAWCRMQGASHIVADTQRSVARVIRGRGYVPRGVQLLKTLPTLQ